MPVKPETRPARLTAPVALPTTVPDIADMAAIPVWHDKKPNVAGLLDLPKDAAYRMVRLGNLPSVHLGRRVFVPVAPLLEQMGRRAEVPS